MQTAQINRGLHIKSSCALHRELFLNITIMSRNLLQILFSSYLISLSFNQLFATKIKNISISSPCHFYFVLYCFTECSWSPQPLRSAQSRGPPDLLWSSLRYGRCKADIHRMSCTLVFALIRVRKHWWDDITQGKQ